MRATETEKKACDPADVPTPLPGDCWVDQGNVRNQKNRLLAPDSWDHMKRMTLIIPHSCIFPYMKRKCLSLSRVWLFETPWTGRVLNSLTWDIWFSLINSNLWCSDCLPSFVISLYISLYISLSLSHLLGAVSQGYLRCCISAWSPKNFPPNKITLFSDCEYFLVNRR